MRVMRNEKGAALTARIPKRRFRTVDELVEHIADIKNAIEEKVPEFFENRSRRFYRFATPEGIREQIEDKNYTLFVLKYFDYSEFANALHSKKRSRQRQEAKLKTLYVDAQTHKVYVNHHIQW